MSLEDIRITTGEWLRGTGPMSDVVVSSRVRLARNLAGFPFLASASATDRSEVYRAVAEEISNADVFDGAFLVDLEEADELDRRLLVERHLISRQQAEDEGSRGVAIWPDETRAIMVNEEDHLRIQAMRSGLQLEASWEDVNRVDDALGERFDYAFDEQLGYLTACPTNVGTGIRVSVMLHLPGLRLTQELEKVSRAANDLRLAVRGMYGEGTEAVGDLVQISNQTTLGKSEQAILDSFGRGIIPKIVEYERAARQVLSNEHAMQLDDRVWRAYGVLSQARSISTDETLTLLSNLRLGIHAGRFDRLDLPQLNEIFLQSHPAHLQKRYGKELDGRERGIARAEYIRQHLAN